MLSKGYQVTTPQVSLENIRKGCREICYSMAKAVAAAGKVIAKSRDGLAAWRQACIAGVGKEVQISSTVYNSKD